MKRERYERDFVRCKLHIPRSDPDDQECGTIAVSIWKAADGPTPVCEQCEAMIVDCAKGGAGSAIFEPLPV
jgi:hypothetical protein